MAPDGAFSNANDKNEFTKFTKFLAYKSVQVIVESRKGVKIEANSKKSTTDSDWFNLQIPDSQEVNQATKNALPSDRILETIRSQLHVEISVQTEDGDEMVLELWTLGLDETQYDTSVKAMNTVYFRMGILLKSLITITRITPAYHLSRKQKTESFTIFYRVYNGEPKYQSLGESRKFVQAGLLKTPLGGFSFSVTYRTNFSITPKSEKTKILLLKSDHFELSPKHVIYESNKKDKEVTRQIKQIDLNKPLRLAAFVDESLLKKAFDDFLDKYPVPGFVFKLKPSPIKEKPMVSKSTQELDNGSVKSKSPSASEMPPKRFVGYRSENELPLKLLYFPFADDHPIKELAEFYKDFFNAPRLTLGESIDQSKSSLIEDKGMDVMGLDLTNEITSYERSVQEFETLLEEMCRSADWGVN